MNRSTDPVVSSRQMIDNGPCSKPCPECPFRTSSAPGWLGPWTPEALHAAVMSEAPFACHASIHRDAGDALDVPRLRICAGSLAYMKANHKLPRDRRLRALVEAAETAGILDAPAFFDHHRSPSVMATAPRPDANAPASPS